MSDMDDFAAPDDGFPAPSMEDFAAPTDAKTPSCVWCAIPRQHDMAAYKECKHETMVFSQHGRVIECVSCMAWWELHPQANIAMSHSGYRVGPHRVCARCKVRGGVDELKAVDETGSIRYSRHRWNPVGKVELVCDECLENIAKDRAAEWEKTVALPTGNGYADQIKALMKAAPFPMTRGAVKAAGDVLWWAVNAGAGRIDSYTPQHTVVFAACGTERVTFQSGTDTP